jgi:type II secretory pathway pseudopilin PulG
MSGTDRRRIANPTFFGRATQPARRVRLVPAVRGEIKKRNSGSDPELAVPAFLLAQRGFTYLGMLVIVALLGFGLAAFGELYSHASQREKERELLFIGNQFRDAIASYYNKSPGAKVYPKKLDDLVEDKRFPMPQHHLRRVYSDPMTRKAEWGLVEAPGGGFMGVHSLSEETPIKSADFSAKDAAFADAENYTKWMFTYSPTGLASSIVPAAKR